MYIKHKNICLRPKKGIFENTIDRLHLFRAFLWSYYIDIVYTLTLYLSQEACEKNILLVVIQMHSHCYIFFPSYDRGTASHISLSTIIGTHSTTGFHVHLKTNSIELWNLAWVLLLISSLICRRRRAICISCLSWMILPSICHRCLVYKLMNCWMC